MLLFLLLACKHDDPTSLLECGPGTAERENECLPTATGTTGAGGYECGEGTVVRGDTCVALTPQPIWLPFEPGFESDVIQGAHGGFSHNGYGVYAVDFDVAEGTTVVAVREGVVQYIREDSDEGCGDERCADDVNVVYIDHGDGTIAKYLHLELNGALVEPDDVIARGQPIGRSGNTGFSTGPHLHLEVTDFFYQSQPLVFADIPENGGQAFAGLTAESANEQQAPPDPIAPSSCPADLFGFMGVQLTGDTPCSVARTGETYQVTGTQFGDAGLLMVARYSLDDGWSYDCHGTEANGEFDIQIEWGQAYEPYGYFVLAAASRDCYSYQSWDTSPFLVVRE